MLCVLRYEHTLLVLDGIGAGTISAVVIVDDAICASLMTTFVRAGIAARVCQERLRNSGT